MLSLFNIKLPAQSRFFDLVANYAFSQVLRLLADDLFLLVFKNCIWKYYKIQ